MLHQTNWKLTNPDWAKEPRKKLIKLIMNQRANSAADLARVLFIHRKLGHEMVALQRRRVREQHAYLKKKWPELRALAKTSDAMLAKIKQKIVDSTKLQKEATDEKERASAKGSLINAHRRLRKIQSAKKVVLRCDKSVSKFLAVKPKAAKPTKKTKEAEDEALAAVPEVERDLEPLPEPIPPLDQAIVEMVIPPTLKSIRGTPWTIKGVECKWADLVDPQYAAKWPQEIAGHQLLHKAHAKVMTEDEYNEREIEMKKEVQKETQAIYEKLKHEATQDERVKKGLPRLPFKEKSEPVKVVEEEKEEEQAKPTGLMRFVPGFIAKRFGGKKATAEA